jgi:hypothetical protein
MILEHIYFTRILPEESTTECETINHKSSKM